MKKAIKIIVNKAVNDPTMPKMDPIISKSTMDRDLPAFALALQEKMNKVGSLLSMDSVQFVSNYAYSFGTRNRDYEQLLQIRAKLIEINEAVNDINGRIAAEKAFYKKMMDDKK